MMEKRIQNLDSFTRELRSQSFRRYPPSCMDHTLSRRINYIQWSKECTEINFIYRADEFSEADGKEGLWIRFKALAYIQSLDSRKIFPLIFPVIEPALETRYYIHPGTYRRFSLVFAPIPEECTKIDIVLDPVGGNEFNFYNVDFRCWNRMINPYDIHILNN